MKNKTQTKYESCSKQKKTWAQKNSKPMTKEIVAKDTEQL